VSTTNRLLPGDLLLFTTQHDAGWRIDTEEALIAFGERLQHRRAPGPTFIHVGIALSETIYAQEDGTAHASQVGLIPPSRGVMVKRLDLTDEQRARIPNAARSMFGERYDTMLDVYLGLRYLATGIRREVTTLTGGLITLPPLTIGHESHDRLICSTYVAKTLRKAGYRGIKKRSRRQRG